MDGPSEKDDMTLRQVTDDPEENVEDTEMKTVETLHAEKAPLPLPATALTQSATGSIILGSNQGRGIEEV